MLAIGGSAGSSGRDTVARPRSCADCVYKPAEQPTCQRHAPAPGTDTFRIAQWPLVKPTDKCGAGAAIGNGSGPSIIQCAWCVYWLQPEGQGVVPDYRQGRPRAWWEQSGYCVRFAPSPSTEEDRKTHWRVTNAHGGCGDGEHIPVEPE